MDIPCFKEVYDISLLLGEAATYPGDVPFSREMVSEIISGGSCDLSTLTLSSHAGTHLDAPAHFIAGGKTLDQYPPERFLLPAHVVYIDDEEQITSTALEGVAVDVDRGEALLLRTRNSHLGLSCQKVFSDRFVYLSDDAANFCLDLGVSMVGIDYLSIDEFGNELYPVHRQLLGNDMLILEGIDLKSVPAGKYLLLCAPLRIKGAEAAPVRAILAR